MKVFFFFFKGYIPDRIVERVTFSVLWSYNNTDSSCNYKCQIKPTFRKTKHNIQDKLKSQIWRFVVSAPPFFHSLKESNNGDKAIKQQRRSSPSKP